MNVSIIGGGPAGMRAAEVLAESGRCSVTLFEATSAVGKKLLVAGKGGLNLTHSEEIGGFAKRYMGGNWECLLESFGPADLRKWAAELGIETYIGTSGRVFPVGQQAARLLRNWAEKLRSLGVIIKVRHPLTGLRFGGELCFGNESERFDRVILALGGASWPSTGSTGEWTELLASFEVEISPWQPANCGWECEWSREFLLQFEGSPLKNLAVSVGDKAVRGELLITRYGLEGGALYQLGPLLRAMQPPTLLIDFKPDAMKPISPDRLAPPVRLLHFQQPAASLHAFPLVLQRPRPIAEAISSAGGVRWQEIDQTLMLHKLPNVWICGEMIDWEAPTGGYLLQGCLTTGTIAARGVLASF